MIFLILPEVEMLDFAGPLQVFSEAARTRPRYRIRLCSTRERVRCDQGVTLADLEPLPDAHSGDLVIVPGMPYRMTERIERPVLRWLRDAHAGGAHVASVCTGAFVLGEAGLLAGRRCTTHWARTNDLQRRFPAARVLADRLFVTDGSVTTSAGIASGIDMALGMIEQAHGTLLAAEIAREMVVYIRRDGAHQQQSIYLDYRTHLHPGVHRIQDWLVQNPGEKYTLMDLGAVAGMSARNLTRVFRRETGISVKDFATRVRLERARALLHDPMLTIEAVAQKCGFETSRQFRRVWRDAFGGTPTEDPSPRRAGRRSPKGG